MKVIRCKNSLTVILSGGRIIQSSDCDNELFEKVKQLQAEDNEFEVINILIPEKEEDMTNNTRLINFWEKEHNSSEITKEGQSVYWKDVSPLSMPMSFAEKVMEAENNKDLSKLEAYKNFWTLLSLNPDPAVRQNLFKFLEKWGMVITKSGLFVGYRNVDILEQGESETDTVYTDHHSHSFRIQIGKMVTMDRKKCDSDSSVECSRGLHLGGTSWLSKGYYGTQGLVCLCNPVDVVAVPWCCTDSSYGKLRTCAYLPIAKAQYDEYGHIIPFSSESGWEAPFVPTILYDGIMATEETATYIIPIPKSKKDICNAKTVSDRILSIARQYMQDKES